jgi:type I restriction enzyme S subunit
MKRYGEYTNIGLPWYPNGVPSHWTILRHKNVLTKHKELVGENSDKYTLLSLTLNGVIIRDLSEGKGKFSKDYDKYVIVNEGDFVFCLFDVDETPRTVGLSKHHGMITGAYDVFTPHDINSDYFFYYYLALDNNKLLKPLYTGLRKVIAYPTFISIKFPVPPRSEQDQIVRFLDYKTARIDKLISGYKRQIELLEERKLTVIDEIVHRGINPSSPKKNSNIDYIGDIPEHWIILQNHRLYKSMNRKFDGEETVLSLSQKDGLIPYEQMTERSLHTASYDNWQLVLPNDLVLNRFKAHLGVFFSSQCRGIATFHYGVYEPKMQLVSKYYEALYHTAEYRRVYAGQSKGMTVGLQNLSDIDFFTVYTVYPPYEEQKAIVAEIEKIEQDYLNAKSHIEHQIALLQEYRTRLISDVVTGQVDVRDETIPETEVN